MEMLLKLFDLCSFSNPALAVKLRSIWCCFAGAVQKVVHDNPTDVPPAKRIAQGRKALQDIFAERGRKLCVKSPLPMDKAASRKPSRNKF